MEYLLTSEEMKRCDKGAIESGAARSVDLMDKASLGVSKVASKILGDVQGKRIAVLCGKGNNGGDGLGAALYLAQMGASLVVYLLEKREDIKGDSRLFYEKLCEQRTLSKNIVIQEFDADTVGTSFDEFDLVIDAILGTGLSGEPTGLARNALDAIGNSTAAVLAVDIQSGLNADNGVAFSYPHAVATATMAYAKRGLIMNQGSENTGKLYVIDIGMPKHLDTLQTVETFVVTQEDVKKLLPQRQKETHKHSVGKIFGLVGSVGLTGAGVLVGQAAMRTGAGAVVLGVPSGLNPILEAKLTEVMTVPLPQTADGSLSLAVMLQIQRNLEWADCLVLGPGLSRNQETEQLVYKVLRGYTGTVVLDADALNAVADQTNVLHETRANIVMTPHHGEFARLTKLSTSEIAKNRIELARQFAEEYGVTLVLKGSPTVIASKAGKVFVNVHGNPGMATAGSGDVLTGIIAALLGQKLSPVEAAICGVYLHSVAGDIAMESKGMYSLIASDIIEFLPNAFVKVIEGELIELEKIS